MNNLLKIHHSKNVSDPKFSDYKEFQILLLENGCSAGMSEQIEKIIDHCSLQWYSAAFTELGQAINDIHSLCEFSYYGRNPIISHPQQHQILDLINQYGSDVTKHMLELIVKATQPTRIDLDKRINYFSQCWGRTLETNTARLIKEDLQTMRDEISYDFSSVRANHAITTSSLANIIEQNNWVLLDSSFMKNLLEHLDAADTIHTLTINQQLKLWRFSFLYNANSNKISNPEAANQQLYNLFCHALGDNCFLELFTLLKNTENSETSWDLFIYTKHAPSSLDANSFLFISSKIAHMQKQYYEYGGLIKHVPKEAFFSLGEDNILFLKDKYPECCE